MKKTTKKEARKLAEHFVKVRTSPECPEDVKLHFDTTQQRLEFIKFAARQFYLIKNNPEVNDIATDLSRVREIPVDHQESDGGE